MSKSKSMKIPSGMQIYCLADKKHYSINQLNNVDVQGYVQGKEGMEWMSVNNLKGKQAKRFRIVGQTPSGKMVSRFISKEVAGSGILGKLFGLPNGEIPLLSQIPLVGALF